MGSRGSLSAWWGGITVRKQADEDLRQQKEIRQEIFDHLPVMVALFDAAGRVHMVNREWEWVLGWSFVEAQGRDILAEC
jgi:PAS domain-containing protein